MDTYSFRSMGTEIELHAVDGADFASAVAEFERLEAILSRFRPESQLSRLNRDGSIDGCPTLARVLELAVDARERTEGVFDPTVHDALLAAGYDRTFAEVPADSPSPAGLPTRCGGRVRIIGTHVELEPGFRVDVGGIGKGFAAESAANLLGSPCLVNAGGDIAVRGEWPIGIDDDVTMLVSDGGVATSGVDRRHWLRGGVRQHHVIDPATGRPAETDILRLTLVAADAIEAEVLATSLLVGGTAAVLQRNLDAVIVTVDGRTIRTGALQ